MSDELAPPGAAIALVVGENDPVFSPTRTVKRGRRVMPADLVVEVLAKQGHGIELSGQAMDVAARFLEPYGAEPKNPSGPPGASG